ncbi:MAG: hypothetical protein ABJE66_20305 [Deltaproteobacteria bacterium]
MFHILANLDQEERWLGTTLPEHIQRRLAVMATLLQALAPEDQQVTVHVGVPIRDPIVSEVWNPPMVDHRPPPRVDLAWCDPSAKQFNDRRFALGLAQQFGCALPRAAALTSIEAIDAHLAAGPDGPWVLKAPWSSAGRHRVFSIGRKLEGEHRVAAERLLARTGALVFEPWCERICDVAVCGIAGVEVTEPHEILNGPRGNFFGIELRPNVLEVGEHDQLVTTAERVAQQLADAGYRGPFGIDAFVHRVDGQRVLHPLCEINARHTFGHVARALGGRFVSSRLEFAHHMTTKPHLRLVAEAHAIKAWIV